MRTFLAALALAVPAAATPALACGGYGELRAPRTHTVEGTISLATRAADGSITVFVSYPWIDGQFSNRYGDHDVLADDAAARRLLRDTRRARRAGTSAAYRARLERTGEAGAWRLVARDRA